MILEQDNIYIGRVLEGDGDAFAFLVEKYKSMVFSLAYSITRNREEAEEVAQDTFVKAYQSLGKFEGKAKFSSWLYRLYIESKKNHESLSREERKRFLDMAMASLEKDERMMVILYYYEERDLEEISEIAGLSKTNTKVKLFRARKKMLIVLNSYLKEEKYSLL